MRASQRSRGSVGGLRPAVYDIQETFKAGRLRLKVDTAAKTPVQSRLEPLHLFAKLTQLVLERRDIGVDPLDGLAQELLDLRDGQ